MCTASIQSQEELVNALDGHNIVGVCEERLAFPLPGFQDFHSHGRIGVGLFIRNGVVCQRDSIVEMALQELGVEAVAARVVTYRGGTPEPLTLISIYIPNGLGSCRAKEVWRTIATLDKVIIFGDLNSTGQHLQSSSKGSCPEGAALDNFLHAHKDICLLSSENLNRQGHATYFRPNYWAQLDACLASTCLPIADWFPNPMLTSDHWCGESKFPLDIATHQEDLPARLLPVNFGALLGLLRQYPLCDDPDIMPQQLKDLAVRSQKRTGTRAKPWWKFSSRLHGLKQQRNRLRAALKLCPEHERDETRNEWQRASEAFKAEVQSAKSRWLQACVDQAEGSRSPFKHLSPIIGSKYSRKNPSKAEVLRSRKKANALAREYMEIASDPDIHSAKASHKLQTFLSDTQLDFYELEPYEIQQALDSTREASPGADQLGISIWKWLWQSEFKTSMEAMLQKAWKTHPRSWRFAIIHPIPKGAGKYRPISLLPCISKVLEKIMATRIEFFILSKEREWNHQFGCSPGLSTETPLMLLLQKSIDAQKHCAIFFSDITKAYDRVNPSVLCCKLIDLGLPMYIIRWCYTLLSERSFAVKVGNSTSELMNPLYGLPQGSPISVTLWKIFFDPPRHPDSFALMDDLATWFTAPTRYQLQQQMQEYLESLWTWGQNNQVTFDVKKSVAMALHEQSEVDVYFGENAVEFVSEYKYLGILLRQRPFHVESEWISPRGWDVQGQYDQDEKQVEQRASMIAQTPNASVRLRRLLYRALIQSKLSYCISSKAPVLELYDQLQWRALRQIFQLLPSTPRDSLCYLTGVTRMHHLLEARFYRLYAGSWRTLGNGRSHPLLAEFEQWLSFPNTSVPSPFLSLYDVHLNSNFPTTALPEIAPLSQAFWPWWRGLWTNIPLLDAGDSSWAGCQRVLFIDGGYDADNEKGSWAFTDLEGIEASGSFAPCASSYEAELRSFQEVLIQLCHDHAPDLLESSLSLSSVDSEETAHAEINYRDFPTTAIVTDCKRLLRFVRHPPKFVSSAEGDVLDLLYGIQERGTIAILWTKAHQGCIGNCRADELCRIALSQDPVWNPLSCDQLIDVARYWSQDTRCEPYSGFLSHITSMESNRQVIDKLPGYIGLQCLRMLADHTHVRAHWLRMARKKQPDKIAEALHLCRRCQGSEETLWHFLSECSDAAVTEIRTSLCPWTAPALHEMTEFLNEPTRWEAIIQFVNRLGIKI